MKRNIKPSKAELKVLAYQFANEAVHDLTQGCRMIGLTRGQFSLIDLITAILNKTGKANVVCVTWSAGIKDANQMKLLKDNEKINTFTLITDHSYAARQKQYAVSLTELFGEENIRTTEIHAKFTLIHNDDWKICIRTSMNLNANRTCENFEIDDNEEIFNFYMDFVEGVVGEMPKGFVKDSRVVNSALKKIFGDRLDPVQDKFDFVW